MTTRPTPLTELTHLGTNSRRIFVKHEQTGATGSIKDRMVFRVLEKEIEAGVLTKGKEIVEASSGNTGTALAFAGAKLGFKVRIFVASTISKEKIAAIESYGAIVQQIEIKKEAASEIEEASAYAKKCGAYFFNQFENPHHITAYQESLGVELVAQLSEREIQLDTFIGGIGSGASLRAIGSYLKTHHNPKIKIFGVSPTCYPSNIEGLNPGDLRREGHFKIWRDREQPFEEKILYVKDDDAYREALALYDHSKISIGPATGAYLYAAQTLQSGSIGMLISDTGAKYAAKFAAWKKAKN